MIGDEQFDAAVLGSLQPDPGQQAQAGYAISSSVDPNSYAEAKKVAQRSGLPIETVLNKPKESKQQADINSINFDALAKTSPVTAAFISEVEKAMISHDNVESMSTIEGFVKELPHYLLGDPSISERSLIGDLMGAFYQADKGVSGALQAGNELLASTINWIDPNNIFAQSAKAWADNAAADDAISKMLSTPSENKIMSGVQSGIQSLGQNALMLPLSLMTGGAGSALTGMASMAGGKAYAEGRSQGLSALQSVPYATSQGMIEFVTEKIPVIKLIGDLNAGSPMLKTFMRQIMAEVPGEQAATMLQDLNDWAVLPQNQDKTIGDYFMAMPGAAAQTLIATMVGSGGNVAVMRGLDRLTTTAAQRLQRAQDTQKQTELLLKLNQAAAADKVLQRDQDTFEQFIKYAAEDGPVQHVFISADALMQSGVAEDVAQASPAVARQIETAAQTGGQISIPVEEYASKIAPTEAAGVLLEHLKVDPEGFSHVEAAQYMETHAEQLESEVNRMFDDINADDAFKQSTDTVKAKILEDLNTVGRFTAQKNEADATLISSYYAVRAAQMGITPEQLYGQMPVNFVAEMDPLGGSNEDILSQKSQDRGAFDPATTTIAMLNGADLSTVLHEGAHFFFENDINLASSLIQKESLSHGEQQIVNDRSSLFSWHGIEGDINAQLAAWENMPMEERRAIHERTAEAFEAYLFEGNPPSLELAPYFQKFRAWLVNVYKSLKKFLENNPEAGKLNDEVRGVFARMLATSEQIQLAEHGSSMVPLFENAEQAGMTPEEFGAYQALGIDASNNAAEQLQARGLRDMKWLHNARSRIIKGMQKENAQLRADMLKQVSEEIKNMPVYRATTFLKTGKIEIPDSASKKERDKATQIGMENHKLSLPALKEMYGEKPNAPWRYLSVGKNGLAATDGIHPDVVAELFGLTSGDELVRKLLEAPPIKDMINEETDARLLEKYGDINSPEALNKAADESVHNDARSKFITTEYNALAKATGKAKILNKAARQFALQTMARLRVMDVSPGQYAGAEKRAAKAAAAAMKSGNLQIAAAEKRNQVLQNHLTRAAQKTQANIEKQVRYLRKFNRRIKGLDIGYQDQIDNLLERFDLRSKSNRASEKQVSLADWIATQQNAGFEPDIPPEIAAEANRKPYKTMTVEELQGLVDTVKQIEHLGRLKKKLLTAKDKREFEAIRDSIASSIREHAGQRKADTRTPVTDSGKAWLSIKDFSASHIKAATWARVMDGGQDGGPMWEYFIRSANECGDKETVMKAEATQRLSEIMAPILKNGKMGGKGTWFPSVERSFNRQQVIAIALNMGNAGNIQRLLGGEGWRLEQVMPVLESMTADEWHAVQAVWDYLESYRPLIAAKELRVYGKEPNWVEPQALTINTADGQTLNLNGGYFPIKYDPLASQRAEEHADAEDAKRQMQGAYTSATTRRSFAKTRSNSVLDRPLLYSLSGIYSGVNDIVHDLCWHEWLIDANRLSKSTNIDSAIREYYGPAVKDQFKTWINDIADGGRGAEGALDRSLARIRQGVSAAGLGFSVMTALMQPLGYTQSIVRVGGKYAARGLRQYIGAPKEKTKEVNEKSSFMANRARTRFRELNELRNQIQDQSAISEWMGRNAYFLMMAMQQTADVPTWLGAYEKAISEGNDEARAISLADQAVIDSQGSGDTKDLSAIERGGPAHKLFTVFYSYMNTALNMGVMQTMTADTPAKKAKLIADYAMLFMAPVVLEYALKSVLIPDDDDDDRDLGSIAKDLASKELEFLMGTVVVVREFDFLAPIVFGERSFGYRGPAGLRAIEASYNLAVQTGQMELDDSFRKALINSLGSIGVLPGAAQINRTITGTKAIAEDKTNNPMSLVFGFKEKR